MFKNFLYKLLLSFYNIIIPILYIPYVYRILNSETIGKIEFTQSLTNYFLIFSGMGIYTYGLREMSKIREDKNTRNQLYSELFFINIGSSIIVLILFLLFIIFKFNNALIERNFLLINSIGLISNIFYVEWVNEAFENYKFIMQKSMIIKLINIILLFSFVKSEKNSYAYLLIINSGILLNNLISYMYINKNFSINFKNINLKKYIKPLFLIAIVTNLSLLYTNFDKIILGFYSQSEEVAYYAIGQKVMMIIYTVVLSIIAVSVPRLSYYIEKNNILYLELLNKIKKYLEILIYPIAIGICVLSKEIIYFFSGEKYMAANITVIIFGLRMIILGYEGLLTKQILFLNGKEKVISIISGICGGINLILKYILYKFSFLNSKTAIFTTALVEIMIIITSLNYSKRKLQIDIKIFSKSQIKYLIASLVFIPIKYGINYFRLGYLITAIITVIICTLSYSLTLFLLKETLVYEIYEKITRKIKEIGEQL